MGGRFGEMSTIGLGAIVGGDLFARVAMHPSLAVKAQLS